MLLSTSSANSTSTANDSLGSPPRPLVTNSWGCGPPSRLRYLIVLVQVSSTPRSGPFSLETTLSSKSKSTSIYPKRIKSWAALTGRTRARLEPILYNSPPSPVSSRHNRHHNNPHLPLPPGTSLLHPSTSHRANVGGHKLRPSRRSNTVHRRFQSTLFLSPPARQTVITWASTKCRDTTLNTHTHHRSRGTSLP